MAGTKTAEPRTFLDINGKRYAVIDGRLTLTGGELISDFVSPDSVGLPPTENLKPLVRTVPTMIDIRQPQHVNPRRPQTAHTLMRSAVSRPTTTKRLKAVTRTDILAVVPKQIIVAPKLSVTTINVRRQTRASSAPRSEQIRHFSPGTVITTQAINQILTPSEALADIKPYLQTQRPSSFDIFERALERADAHTEWPINLRKHAKAAGQQAPKAAGKLRLTLTTISLLCLLLIGFIGYQNKTGLTMHYASSKAGFSASLPSYRPAGFTASKVDYRLGSVSVAYNNRSSQQSYTLTQQPTTYDDQSLLTDVVAGSKTAYQTLQRYGRTVYVYNNNNAAWIQNGILYQLQSHGNLSTSQVLDVASSF